MGEITLQRRSFLISTTVAAGGMALAITPAQARKAAKPAAPWGPSAASGSEFGAWIEIAADDTVTIRTPQPESGNGTMTQIAMNVAEELECDWSNVRAVTASLNRDWTEKHVYTQGFLPFFSGHATAKDRMTHCLQLGASARERLKEAAAQRWKVPRAEVTASQGVLTHAPSRRTLRYGQIAAEAAKVALLTEPALKPQSAWTLIGKRSVPKLSIPDIASGKAVFGIDVQVPGMVHAALMQVPVMGGRLKSHSPEAVLKMPGVRAVVVIDPANSRKSPVKQETMFGLAETKLQHGVAVIADHYWQAKVALEALPVEWDLGGGAQVASADALYETMRSVRDSGKGRVVKEKGALTAATGKRVVEAEYLTPYCENAPLEPLSGTALVTADSAEVWCATQDSRQAFWVAVDETGLDPAKVKLNAAYVGGNFGRRTQSEDTRIAVAVARAYPGVPVKTIWSREECFRQGRYRTPMTSRFKAVLDDLTGMPQSVAGDLCFGGDRPMFQLSQGYSDPPFFNNGAIPNVRLTTSAHPVHLLNGAYRGPCYNSSAFFVETFIDECAHAAGADPLAYRLKLLEGWDKSWSDCLQLVAEKAGWGKVLPKGEGIGIAIAAWPMVMKNMGSVVAAAVRVSVTPQGELSVKQVDLAFDCGRVANADAVRAQMEGAAIWGLNMTLNEDMTIADGAMVEGNFDEYPMLRMADLPPINVHFGALSGQNRFEIMGEVPVGPVGPALGNAIHIATGKRLRTTPFRKQDLSWT